MLCVFNCWHAEFFEFQRRQHTRTRNEGKMENTLNQQEFGKKENINNKPQLSYSTHKNECTMITRSVCSYMIAGKFA